MSETLSGIQRCMQSVLTLTDEDAARIGPETTPLAVPGWNSMAHVQIVLELERAFGVAFDADEIAGIASVAAMIAAIERSRT